MLVPIRPHLQADFDLVVEATVRHRDTGRVRASVTTTAPLDQVLVDGDVRLEVGNELLEQIARLSRAMVIGPEGAES